MKKILALLPMIAAFALTGCGNNEKESEDGENLAISQEQAKEKMAQLATTSGYEITFRYVDSEDEGEPATQTVGVKDDYFWVYSSSQKDMIHFESDNSVKVFEWSEEESTFKVDADAYPLPAETYKQIYENYGTWLYFAFTYDGLDGFHKVKDTTFVGRSATEYKLRETYMSAYVEAKVIVDKETGITLYFGWEGRDLEGESGSAAFEVTSFKTGAAVDVPSHE